MHGFFFLNYYVGDTIWGINGETGEIVKMDILGIWEPLSVKLQTYKTAIEVSNA